MLQGLYKVEMKTVHGARRGVLYCFDGKMLGGNSAFIRRHLSGIRRRGDGRNLGDAPLRRSEFPAAVQDRHDHASR